MPQGITQGGWKVTLQGYDITNACLESTFDCQDTLGQGPGVAAGSSGRAKKAGMRTSLGPAASAVGAGQPIPVKNLLTANQSDIETDTTGFSTAPSVLLTSSVQATISRDTSTSWHGAASLHVNTGAVTGGSNGVEVSPGVTVLAGSQVTISFYFKTTGNGGALRVHDYTNNTSPSGYTLPTPQTSWTRATYTFTQSQTTHDLRFAIRSSVQYQDIWIDGLQVEVGAVATNWALGQSLTALVRQGELKVYDSTGACVYGGLVTDISDQIGIKESGRQVIYTDISSTDYWQDWDRINIVSEVFDGSTDISIIRYLIGKYTSGVDLTRIPSSGGMQLGAISFRNISLQKAIQRVADKTGYACWVTPSKAFLYAAPGGFANAPFALSTTPDFSSSFQMGFVSYQQDDTSAINRVTFYGGKQLSSDYTQDISPLCNGNADTIQLAYYPHKASDGHYHVTVGGVAQVVGFYGSTGAANTLKKSGGNCDVLINIDAHTLIFSTAPSNSGVNSVTAKYRYEAPLVVQIADNNSVSFYGRYLDGTIVDTSVFDTQTAVMRCRTLLNEQARGLATLKVVTWKAGIQSGMLLRVDHDSRNIHGTFLVQEVDMKPIGGGNFRYEITAGAWHWNLIDFVVTTAQNAATGDTSSSESTTATQIESMSESVNAHEAWTTQTRTQSAYTWGNAKFGLASF